MMSKKVGYALYFSKQQKEDYAKLMKPYRAQIIDDLRSGIEWRYMGKNTFWVERKGKRVEDSHFDSALHNMLIEGIVFWQDDILQLSEDYK